MTEITPLAKKLRPAYGNSSDQETLDFEGEPA